MHGREQLGRRKPIGRDRWDAWAIADNPCVYGFPGRLTYSFQALPCTCQANFGRLCRPPMTQRTAAWYDKPPPPFMDAIALVRHHRG